MEYSMQYTDIASESTHTTVCVFFVRSQAVGLSDRLWRSPLQRRANTGKKIPEGDVRDT